MIPQTEIVGLVLAGGRASRMNFQDKALLPLHNRPLIEYVTSNAAAQVGKLVISANRNPHKYEYLGCPIIPDHDYNSDHDSDSDHGRANNYAGPLLGICSAMRWAQSRRAANNWNYLACFAADVPSFPENLVRLLSEHLLESNSVVACSRCEGQLQPLFSLWSLDTLAVLEAAIDRGIFGPKPLLPEMSSVIVDFEKREPGYFFNINSEQGLARAAELIKSQATD
jgi:molybdopterin-guanine dinucleotide biosynthesis protein A